VPLTLVDAARARKPAYRLQLICWE
jgi:hypothetical protein